MVIVGRLRSICMWESCVVVCMNSLISSFSPGIINSSVSSERKKLLIPKTQIRWFIYYFQQFRCKTIKHLHFFSKNNDVNTPTRNFTFENAIVPYYCSVVQIVCRPNQLINLVYVGNMLQMSLEKITLVFFLTQNVWMSRNFFKPQLYSSN